VKHLPAATAVISGLVGWPYGAALAQAPDANPFTTSAKQQFDRIHALVARAAEKAGDDSF
jgi:hypothetical protein